MGGLTEIAEPKLPRWYSNAWTQLLLMSLTVFCGPGLFNALNSIGLGGDPHMGKLVNACLYGTWMATSAFTPAVCNIFGAKWSLFFGTLGYPVYSLAMYYRATSGAVAAGCFLGVTAGMLWTAQGQLMMSYPAEEDAGKYIAVFWAIFNSGGVLGSLASFGLNFQSAGESTGGGLSPATYFTFLTLMCAGVFLSVFVLPISLVTRGDYKIVQGTATELSGYQLVKQEFVRTVGALKSFSLLCFIPLFFYSNFFYAYHFGLNGVLFDARTSSLAAAFYWLAQIIGAIMLQRCLDASWISRRTRMFGSFTGILAYIAAIWTLGGRVQYDFDVSYDRTLHLDFTNITTLRPLLCLLLWGFADSFVQVWSYWMMRLLSDDPEELACYTAFYKFWQNAGAFASFELAHRVNNAYVDYWTNVGLITALALPTLVGIHSAGKHSDCKAP